MESQKIKHFLDHKENTYSKYQTKNGISLMIKIMDNMVKEIIMMILLK